MKKLIACFLLVVAVTTANAAYLYWQVDTAAGDNTASSFGTEYNAARIGYYLTSKASSYATLKEREGVNLDDGGVAYVVSDGYYGVSSGSMGAPASLDMSTIASAENYSYFIELVNYNSGTSTHVAYGEDLSYADLVAKNYIDTGLKGNFVPTTWHGGEYHAVPEPTSALMMVFGLAFLGLKRHRV